MKQCLYCEVSLLRRDVPTPVRVTLYVSIPVSRITKNLPMHRGQHSPGSGGNGSEHGV